MELKLTLSFYSSIMFVMIVIETYISEQIAEYRKYGIKTYPLILQ